MSEGVSDDGELKEGTLCRIFADELTVHAGDRWVDGARRGMERCGGCGEEWSLGDEPGCVCGEAFEEVEEDE